MSDLQVGTTVELTVKSEAEYGYYLTDGNESILLHTNELEGKLEVDDEVTVFLFHDKQGRITATMSIPEVQLDQYGWAEIVDVHERLGAFVHIGLHKDMLVSQDDLPEFREVWPEKGDWLFVKLELDKQGRLLAKPATEDVIQDLAPDTPRELFNRNIFARVYRASKVGTFVITEEDYRGFIHESERKIEPRLGELVECRVIDVKTDGTFNASVLPRKHEIIDDDAATIYKYMEMRGGNMPYSDKSDPTDIQFDFKMSKGSFKRALGKLMKENKVYQEDGWTYFVKEDQE